MTGKQQKFIEFYLGESNCNGVDAARRAGYAGGYAVLGVTAHDNLKNPKIAAEIKRKLEERAMSAEQVLSRLAEQAQGIGEYVRYHKNQLGKFEAYVDLDKLIADGKGHLVKCIKRDAKTGDDVIEFYDAQTALLNLGRYHKLFVDKTENSTNVSVSFEDELNDLPSEELAARLSKAVRLLGTAEGIPETS